jgi:hypothetical protein
MRDGGPVLWKVCVRRERDVGARGGLLLRCMEHARQLGMTHAAVSGKSLVALPRRRWRNRYALKSLQSGGQRSMQAHAGSMQLAAGQTETLMACCMGVCVCVCTCIRCAWPAHLVAGQASAAAFWLLQPSDGL